MSIEFELHSDQPLPTAAFTQAKNDIVRQQIAEVMSDGDCDFLLRWTGSAFEDIAINLSEHCIYIAFHTGSAEQRTHILSTFQECLTRFGVEDKFEEL